MSPRVVVGGDYLGAIGFRDDNDEEQADGGGEEGTIEKQQQQQQHHPLELEEHEFVDEDGEDDDEYRAQGMFGPLMYMESWNHGIMALTFD
jgi:hypothetical protein